MALAKAVAPDMARGMVEVAVEVMAAAAEVDSSKICLVAYSVARLAAIYTTSTATPTTRPPIRRIQTRAVMLEINPTTAPGVTLVRNPHQTTTIEAKALVAAAAAGETSDRPAPTRAAVSALLIPAVHRAAILGAPRIPAPPVEIPAVAVAIFRWHGRLARALLLKKAHGISPPLET